MSPTQNLLPDTPTTALIRRPATTGRPARSRPPPPHRRWSPGSAWSSLWAVSGSLLELGFVGVVLLGVLLLAAFHTLVRRRPLRALLVRDTASFAHRWRGKAAGRRGPGRSSPPRWC